MDNREQLSCGPSAARDVDTDVDTGDSKDLSTRSSLENMQSLEFQLPSQVPQGGRCVHLIVL